MYYLYGYSQQVVVPSLVIHVNIRCPVHVEHQERLNPLVEVSESSTQHGCLVQLKLTCLAIWNVLERHCILHIYQDLVENLQDVTYVCIVCVQFEPIAHLTIYLSFLQIVNEMTDVLGHHAALYGYTGNNNNLGSRDELWYESCPRCRINCSTCWPVIQRTNTVLQMPLYTLSYILSMFLYWALHISSVEGN